MSQVRKVQKPTIFALYCHDIAVPTVDRAARCGRWPKQSLVEVVQNKVRVTENALHY